MRLSKTTNYAIRILLDCAQGGGALVKVADISQRRDITPQNTFKIVHLLSRAGFITAVRGRNGGVRLARPAAKIRIGDVVRAMETLRFEGEGEPGRPAGADRRQLSKLDDIFDSALAAFISVLDEHTLADMTKGKGPRRAPSRKKNPPAISKAAARYGGPFRRQPLHSG
jgi:Rrf2 family nitric oxide-sensitive transcriptional repressor